MFDVKQTCKEVYDSTRRTLLKQQQSLSMETVDEDISQAMENEENEESQVQVRLLFGLTVIVLLIRN